MTPRGLRYSAALEGETRNVSEGGIAIVVPRPPADPRWAVRLELGTHSALLEVVIRHIHKLENGKFYLACEFVRRLDRGPA